MDKQMSDSIQHIIAKVVGLLVRQDYAGIESLSKGIRLKANHIEAGVIDYQGNRASKLRISSKKRTKLVETPGSIAAFAENRLIHRGVERSIL